MSLIPYIFEYIWIGGNNEYRSKIRILELDSIYFDNKLFDELLELLKINYEWNYDGSSTNQASVENSEVILKPVYMIKNKLVDTNNYLILCDTYNIDENNFNIIPTQTNNHHNAKKIFCHIRGSC